MTRQDHARAACTYPDGEHTCWYSCEHPGGCDAEDPRTAWCEESGGFRCPAHTATTPTSNTPI